MGINEFHVITHRFRASGKTKLQIKTALDDAYKNIQRADNNNSE